MKKMQTLEKKRRNPTSTVLVPQTTRSIKTPVEFAKENALFIAENIQTDAELREYMRAFRYALGERQRKRAAVKYFAAHPERKS